MNPDDVLKAVIHDKGKGLRNNEAIWLIDFCCNLNPRIALDVGTGWGVTGRIFSLTSGKVYSIDIGGAGYARKMIAEHGRPEVVTFFQSPSIDVILPIPFYTADLLFIDAGHPTLYVLADFMKYSRYVKNGGVILFHDCDRKDVVIAVNLIEAQNPRIHSGYKVRHFHSVDITRAYYWEKCDQPADINRVDPSKSPKRVGEA